MCAQACRLPYELKNGALQKSLPSPGDHLLSPQDLCTVDMVPQLVEAGVASLKIEGRMKSPEYVAAVVAVYRKALDGALAARAAEDAIEASVPTAPVTDDDRTRLAEAFSRGFTTAYLEGERGNAIMSYQRPNNRGLFLGRVDEVRDGAAFLSSSQVLAEGDVLEFWTRKGNAVATLGPVRTPRPPSPTMLASPGFPSWAWPRSMWGSPSPWSSAPRRWPICGRSASSTTAP